MRQPGVAASSRPENDDGTVESHRGTFWSCCANALSTSTTLILNKPRYASARRRSESNTQLICFDRIDVGRLVSGSEWTSYASFR